MIFLLLFLEFVKIGLFSFGGGYATLPFLYHMAQEYNWFSNFELTQMLALSSITPGPIGLNMATFAGFKTAGILGSIVATTSIVLPSLIFVIIVSKMLKKFSSNLYVKSVLYALRPACAAMIAAVAFKLFCSDILKVYDYKALCVFLILLLISLKIKRDPLVYLLLGVMAGILFNLKAWIF